MCREEPFPARIRTGGGAGERQGSSTIESGDRGAKPVAPLSERLEIPSGPMAEPWAVAWYNHVEPWSPEHKMLLKQHLKHYADAGGTYITTYGVHSPWSDNSYMIEGGMIEWIKKADGTWAFDYKIFDEYVELAMECGIDEAITSIPDSLGIPSPL